MRLTNRDLARRFGVSLTQIKRWAVIVLGRDPEADQSGGVRREYTLDDAFLIYLFGEILVRNFRIGLKEAKRHMDQIMPQLKAEKLLPSNIDIDAPDGIMQLIPTELRVKAQNKTHKVTRSEYIQYPFVNINIIPIKEEYSIYVIEWGIFSYDGDMDINGKRTAEIDVIRQFIPVGLDWPNQIGAPQYVIVLADYLEGFLELIGREMKY
jgi:hypothetical protein